MKIKIEHVQNTFNYGSMMMAITLIKGLESHNPNIEIFVDADHEIDLERLKRSTQISHIKMAPKREQRKKKYNRNIIAKVRRLFEAPKKLLDIKQFVEADRERYDALLIIGGDNLSEYYGKLFPIIEVYKLFIYSKKIPVILVGQTMGPFTSYRKNLVSFFLKSRNISIYTRDDNCFNYLKNELRLTNVKPGRDLAFIDLPMQSDVDQLNSILNRYKLLTNNYITIVSSGLIKCYCSNEKQYLEKFTELINKLCEFKKLDGKKIVILAHVVKPENSDDRNVMKYIQKNLENRSKEKVTFIFDELLPHEARYILGNGLLTVTGRMHAAVSTFQCHKPAISLSYSVKYAGVIGNGLDMDKLIIECAGDEYWYDDYIIEQVKSKLDYVIDHYSDIQLKLTQKVAECKQITQRMIYEINTLIN